MEGDPLVLDNDKWVNLKSPGYCVYDNNLDSINSYGLLYNGYVIDTNVCPAGWHIPTEKEWIDLTKEFVRINQNEKSDTSFIKMRPGHRRGAIGEYYIFECNTLFEGNGPWWCSSNSEAIAWNRFKDYMSITYNKRSYREYGISIRCVKD
jgi:uncharacterized protein (TIGR02145 family)